MVVTVVLLKLQKTNKTNMTVKELIKVLSEMDKNKVVIISEPDQIGWTNIGKVIEEECQIKIVQDDTELFN